MPQLQAHRPFDMDEFLISGNLGEFFQEATVVSNSSTTLVLHDFYDGISEDLTLTGNFENYVGDYPTTGTVTGGTYSISNGTSFTFSDISMSVEDFTEYVLANDITGLFTDLLDGNDQITGSTGADVLLGFAGNDSLDGGGGADSLTGGTGDDTYYVGEGDSTWEQAGEGTDTVHVAMDYQLGSNIENVVIGGTGDFSLGGNTESNTIQGNSGSNLIDGWEGNDTVNGGGGHDTLFGWTGNDIINGGDGEDWIFGEGGIDTLTGGAGADSFAETAAGLNGDTITDFATGDAIIIRDADISTFSHSLTGSTLTYSGGSLTLSGLAAGSQLTAAAADGGGVQLTLSIVPPPPPPPPSVIRAKLLVTESGQDFIVGGDIAVLGTTGGGEVIEIVHGDITLDASFNAGGDTVVLPGAAGSYTAVLAGSFVTIEGGDISVAIPVGIAGLAVQFGDSTRILRVDTGSGQVMLGTQTVNSTEQPVAASGPALSDSAETGPASLAKLILAYEGQDVDIGGNVSVFGTAAPGEVITVLGGNIRLDASFNAGGDTVALSGPASVYSATLSGSFVTISDGETSVAIPVGLAGLTVAFSDVSLSLRIDQASGTVLLGDQTVTTGGDWDYAAARDSAKDAELGMAEFSLAMVDLGGAGDDAFAAAPEVGHNPTVELSRFEFADTFSFG